MASATNPTTSGMTFSRKYTKEGTPVFDLFEYDYRTSVIRNPSGEVVFEMTNVEVPKGWSQIATDILAQKYFPQGRRAAGGWHHGPRNLGKAGGAPHGQLLARLGRALRLFCFRERCAVCL
jgi:hypothetical protein